MSESLPRHRIDGDGDTTVFMFHGAYGDGRYFGNTGDYLVSAGYRVVVWDCPGYAGSVVEYGTAITDHAKAAADLVRAVGSQSNILLGHSMGGMIAPAAAALLGDSAQAVVLSATSSGLQTRNPEARQSFIDERVTPISQGKTIGEYAPGLLATMMGPGAAGPLVDRVIEVVTEMPSEVFLSSMDAIIAYDGMPALRELTVPTLLLAGEFDTACPPADMALMAERIPDSEMQVLAGVGHYPFAEAPDSYHEILLDFLSRRVTRTSAAGFDSKEKQP
ncbi:UNVERIFIED_ORG: pimeloyl-ACP methyl ester carboxylesterase [Rhodococcus erythropolis]